MMLDGKKVLAVDDDEVILQVIKVIVEKRGAAVTLAGSAAKVNEILQDKGCHFDLIFVDLIMPKITGWEVINTLRENPETKDTPILVFTGASLSPTEEGKLLVKANAVIEKSHFTLTGFNKILDQWL